MPEYRQSPVGARRDAAARYAWSEELTDQERRAIRRAAFHLTESCRHFGDVMLAELIYALGQGGYLETAE